MHPVQIPEVVGLCVGATFLFGRIKDKLLYLSTVRYKLQNGEDLGHTSLPNGQFVASATKSPVAQSIEPVYVLGFVLS